MTATLETLVIAGYVFACEPHQPSQRAERLRPGYRASLKGMWGANSAIVGLETRN